MLLQPLLIYPEKLPLALTSLSIHWFFNAFEDLLPDLMTFDSGKSVIHGKRLSDFQIIFVSLSYAANLINFVKMVKEGGIPLLKRERDKGMYPVFICGGTAAMLNPLPLTEIFDAVFVGEGECMEKDMKKILNMDSREELDSFLSSLSYCYNDIKPSADIVRAENGQFFVHSNKTLHKMGNTFDNRLIVELNRSCTSRCKFCAATYLYETFRVPEKERVMEYVDTAVSDGKGLALMGTSLGSIDYFDEILEKAAQKSVSISISSIKVKEINEKRLKLLKKCGVKTITVAIESGIPATRKAILKDISDSEILTALKMIKDMKFKSKLYFIAGLPGTEAVEEAQSVVDLLLFIKNNGGLGETSISVAPFVPKPLTPYRDFDIVNRKEYKKYMEILKKGVSKISSGIKIDFYPYRESELDAKFGFYQGEAFIKLITENI